MKDRKKGKTVLVRLFPFALIAVMVCSLAFMSRREEQTEERQRLVRVWNIDTFEGGKGSRTSFLKRVAARAEKEREGVYYLVTSYTAEGAREAFEQGDAPDLLSFGIGSSLFAERSLPLAVSFPGGETQEGCLAYPWCRGGYALFSLTEEFGEKGKTAISAGRENLSGVAALLNEIEGEVLEPLAAYTGFLNGTYRYLLGTQRDLCRFSSRGVAVFYRSLEEYCDLYQYISVLSAQKREDCFAFVEELLSERTQGELDQIGMYPLGGAQGGLAGGPARYTVSVFSSPEALLELRRAAECGERKIVEKYLKTI